MDRARTCGLRRECAGINSAARIAKLVEIDRRATIWSQSATTLGATRSAEPMIGFTFAAVRAGTTHHQTNIFTSTFWQRKQPGRTTFFGSSVGQLWSQTATTMRGVHREAVFEKISPPLHRQFMIGPQSGRMRDLISGLRRTVKETASLV